MPFFKTTQNILVNVDQDELHNDNWFDTPFLQLPPNKNWDYSRDLTIEDIEEAVQAIISLVRGSKQGHIYSRLEREKKKKRLMDKGIEDI